MTTAYDVIVIGSGPGGEGASMKLAKRGQRVATIEMQDQVGGTVRTRVLSRARHCGILSSCSPIIGITRFLNIRLA